MNIITIFIALMIFLKAISIIQFIITLLKTDININYFSVLSNFFKNIIEIIKFYMNV